LLSVRQRLWFLRKDGTELALIRTISISRRFP
jgi:hypothetical protein